MTHPASHIDDVVHQRARLGILAVLMEAPRATFGHLKQSLGLTDGTLSRHLQVLEAAGHVTITKTFEGKRPRTWATATGRGRAVFEGEIRALKAIVDRFERREGLQEDDGSND